MNDTLNKLFSMKIEDLQFMCNQLNIECIGLNKGQIVSLLKDKYMLNDIKVSVSKVGVKYEQTEQIACKTCGK